MTAGLTYTLAIRDSALRPCFALADRLAEYHGLPHVEYAFLGLSSDLAPLKVIHSLLLPGQHVSDQSVVVPGTQVFGSLRREVDSLSDRVGQRLVPVAFIHRHPTEDVSLSEIDRQFLVESFLNQVAATITFRKDLAMDVAIDPACQTGALPSGQTSPFGEADSTPTEYAIAFSLIISGQRSLAVYAARKIWCPRCGRPRSQLVPATVRVEYTDGPDGAGDPWQGDLSEEILEERLHVTGPTSGRTTR